MSAPEALMRSWVVLVTNLTTIIEDDDEPTAPRPDVDASTTTYATIGFDDDDTATQTPYEVLTDDAGSVDPTKFDQIRSETTRGTLNVEFFGPGSVDYARTLRRSITRQDVLDLLNAAGDYAILKASEVTNDPILRSATREPHASIQFSVEWIESETYEMAAVASIDSTDVTVTEE
jgi:hypothetical protein